jgi:translation initiation factor 3 subunit F
VSTEHRHISEVPLTSSVDLLTASAAHPVPSAQPPLAALSSSLDQLSTLLDQSLAYVQSVNSGSAKADPEVGRYLLEGVGRWSATGNEDEGGIKEGLQDTLTVAYLANLLRSQIELAGRLTLLQQAQAAP